jgi:hypothetical protein
MSRWLTYSTPLHRERNIPMDESVRTRNFPRSVRSISQMNKQEPRAHVKSVVKPGKNHAQNDFLLPGTPRNTTPSRYEIVAETSAKNQPSTGTARRGAMAVGRTHLCGAPATGLGFQNPPMGVSLGNRALARELTARIEVTRGGAHKWTGRAAVPETQSAPPHVVSRCAAVVKDEAHHVAVEEEQTRTASPSRKSRPVPRRCPGINVLAASRRCPRRLPPTSPRPQVRSIRPRSRSLVCFFSGPSGWSFFLGRGKGRKVENGRDFFRSQPNRTVFYVQTCFFDGPHYPGQKICVPAPERPNRTGPYTVTKRPCHIFISMLVALHLKHHALGIYKINN